MNRFSIKSVEEFADVVTGGTPSTRKPEYWDGDIPWLNSGSLNEGHIKSASKFITELGLKNSSAKIMPKNTVLVALTGATTGQVGYLTLSASANQSVTGILPSDEHDPQYLYYFLKTQRHKFLKDAFGGAQPHINQRYVKEFKIPLPGLSVQKRIAYLLSKVEGLIEQRKQHIQDLDVFLKSVFVNMFGDPVRNEKGWDVSHLENLSDRVIDCPHSTPKYSPDKTGYYCIRSSDIENGHIRLEDTYQVTEETFSERIKRHKPSAGDIVYSREGGRLGNAARIMDDEKICLGQRIMLFKACEQYDSDFLWALLESKAMKRKVQSLVGGGAAPRVNIKALKSIQVIRPTREAKESFSAIVRISDKLRNAFSDNLVQLENLYGSLSQKAFAGELDLSRVPIVDEIIETMDIKDEATFEKAPEIELPEYKDQDINTTKGRLASIEHWFDFYQNARGNAPIEVHTFVELVNRRLEDLMDDPVTIDVETYNWLSRRVWEQLKDGDILQGYDEENNTIKLTRS